jgi:hypothetical protein
MKRLLLVAALIGASLNAMAQPIPEWAAEAGKAWRYVGHSVDGETRVSVERRVHHQGNATIAGVRFDFAHPEDHGGADAIEAVVNIKCSSPRAFSKMHMTVFGGGVVLADGPLQSRGEPIEKGSLFEIVATYACAADR